MATNAPTPSLVKPPYMGTVTSEQVCSAESVVASLLRVDTLEFEESVTYDFYTPSRREETFIMAPRGKGLIKEITDFKVNDEVHLPSEVSLHVSRWLFYPSERNAKFKCDTKYSITFSRGFDYKTLPEQIKQAIMLVAASITIPGAIDIQALRALELRDLRVTTDASNQGYKSISDLSKLKSLLRLYFPPRGWYANY